MGGLPRPKPSILDNLKVAFIEGGRKVYFEPIEKLYYSWDSLHGEVEGFNHQGRHIGAACPITGTMLKPAVRGRRVNPN